MAATTTAGSRILGFEALRSAWRLAVAIFVVYLPVLSVGDTDPPFLTISDIHSFLFHVLVTIQLDEDGSVYCGALMNSGGGTFVPSAFEMETGTNLDGHGSTTVSAHQLAQVVVAGLFPSTVYDVYCYAKDAFMNGIDIAPTLQSVTTASGGDYTPPTLWYVAPFEMVDSTEIRVYFQMSEDGTAWCVARRDPGSGTSTPSSYEIINNVGSDAWGQASLTSAFGYQNEIKFQGLDEDTTYDIYCFAKDMSGNGIDHTPALPPVDGAIEATKRTITTLATLVPTRFHLITDSGDVFYLAEPATWNVLLPRKLVSGSRELRSLESTNAPVFLRAAQIVDAASWDGAAGLTDVGLGCAGLPPPPRFGGPFVALLQRGRCAFQAKALRAQAAGYQGIIVVDYDQDLYDGALPGMTTGSDAASKVDIPGWLVAYATGQGIAAALSGLGPGRVWVDIEDRHRKPTLANQQRDLFGLRNYIAI